MSRYAIDVVILPPEPVMDLAISWNKRLSYLEDQSIMLNTMDTLPHVSLLMGGLATERLQEATATLDKIIRRLPFVSMEITGLRFTDGSHPVAALDIALSHELSGFQRVLIEAFRPLITQDVQREDLFDAPPINASAVEWINRFMPEQCYERFWPHITLGHGRLVEKQQSLTFRATRIAICHLGNHCTCRKILAEVQLVG
jgi:hypothetical protein